MRANRQIHALVCFLYSVSFGLGNAILPFHTRACIEASVRDGHLFLFGDSPSEASKLFAYSMVLSSYSTAKLLCLPIVSSLADRYGRLAVMRVSLLGLGLVLLFTAFTTRFEYALLLRTLLGVFGSNAALLQAWVSDIADETWEKNRNLLGDSAVVKSQTRGEKQILVKSLLFDAFMLWEGAAFLGALFVRFVADFNLVYLLAGVGPLLATCVLFMLKSPPKTTAITPSTTTTTTRHLPPQRDASIGTGQLLTSMLTNGKTRWILFVDLAIILCPRMDFVPILENLGLGIEGFTWILTWASIAAICVVIFNLHPSWLSKQSIDVTVSRCYFIMFLLTICLPHAPFGVVCLLVIVRSIIISICEPCEKSIITALAPPESLSAFIGIQHTVRGLSQTVGTFLTSYLLSFAFYTPYTVLAGCYAAISILYLSYGHNLH